jgi:cytochrome c553
MKPRLWRYAPYLALVIFANPAHADAAAGAQKAQVCFACHGPQGNSKNPMYPILAGQTFRYLYAQLQDFKAGRRTNPIMSPQAANLSKQDQLDLAEYFSQQKPISTGFQGDPKKVAKGKALSDQALCPMCHLGEFSGQNEVPREAGQYRDYIAKQLHDFRAHRRTNDAGNMAAYTKSLSDEDIDDLAEYIASLY